MIGSLSEGSPKVLMKFTFGIIWRAKACPDVVHIL